MQNELEKGILKYVDSSIENAPYTQIYTGLIKASGVDGYTINLNGVEYTNVPSEGSFSTNDTVKVVIPNNQPSNMFILAEPIGGVGTGAVSSVNGMTGDVVISNVDSADKLSSTKTITLSGDATGSVSTDFSTSPTISVTVVDDSHNHIISNVDGLQTALDGKSNVGHYHATDRNRANHTGTQTSSTISDFASTVRSTVLTGLSTATNAIISATDTVLSALGKLQAQITTNLSTLTTHIGRTNNPHSVTKKQVGLGNVADVLQYSASNPQLNVTGSSGSCTGNSATATKLATAKTISLTGDVTGSVSFDGLANVSITSTVVDDSHNHVISNVDNLQTTLNVKADLVDGKVPSSQLPSFVDDVLEYATLSAFPVTGTSGVIYIDLSTNLAYRWSGTVYVEISPSLALGETSSTAYRGDRGVIAYNHSLSTSNPHNTTASQIGLGNVPNVTTNNQTPTFTMAGTDSNLVSGEKLTISFGKIAKAINSLISHIADSIRHITATERTNWNTAHTNNHTHLNKTILDNTTASYTTAEQTKLSGIENRAEVNNISDTNATDLTDGGNTTLHYHTTDRNRASHTGTQISSTISDFASTVRSTVLTGLSTATNAIISATDTVLSALGKLQAQITANLSTLNTHIGRTNNPHSVTKAQVGLGNVDNTSDATKNVLSATKLTTAKTINLTGDVAGSVSTDFSTNPSITTTVVNNSHNHNEMVRIDLTGQTLDINTLNLSDGSKSKFYVEKTNGGSAGITNIPVSGLPFILNVESVRYWNTKDYTTIQTFVALSLDNTSSDGVIYKRHCIRGIWGNWYEEYSSRHKQPDVAKLTTARTLAISGGVNGTATSFDGTGNVSIPVTSVNPSYLRDGYTKHQIYLDTHPENGKAIIPFINNDIAFLLRRGGATSVYYDGVLRSIDVSSFYDGSPSYWRINPTGVTSIVIEITLHKTFNWTNTMYVAFGSSGWRATNITFDVMNTNNSETEWTNKSVVTGNTLGEYFFTFLHNGSRGFNKMRLTFSGWNNPTDFRIAQIGLLNYGSEGLKETYVSKGGSSLYGTLYPFTDSVYDLGTTANRWLNVYADNLIGALNGNASTATALQTARNISLSGDVTGSVSFDGSGNSNIVATVVDDSHNHVISNVDNLQTTLDSKLNSSAYNATDVLAKIKTVDGSGSGLDADTVDTYHVNNTLNTGSLWTSDKILSTVESYGSHFDIVQYSGTYAVNDILTMTVPTITNNKSNGIEVLLYRNSAYESALLGIDYTYKYTSATQIQVQFFTAGTYIANYGFYNVGSWILEWQ